MLSQSTEHACEKKLEIIMFFYIDQFRNLNGVISVN